MSDRIFIIIVSFNGMKWLKKCIESVYESTIPVEVIIVDNASNDGSITFIQSHYPQATLIEARENLGFGKANNLGILKAIEMEADFLFLLNQDAYLSPNATEVLLKEMKGNPEYGILSPFHLNGKGTRFDKNFLTNFLANNMMDFISDCYLGATKRIYDVGFVMAAFWFVRIETVKKIGLFNPLFNHYGEDNDYLSRLAYHKLKVGVCPEAKGFHDREDRIDTTEKNIYKLYVQVLVVLSDINNAFFPNFVKYFAYFSKRLFVSLVSFDMQSSRYHLRYYYRLVVRNFFKIQRSRTLNMRAFPFSDQ